MASGSGSSLAGLSLAQLTALLGKWSAMFAARMQRDDATHISLQGYKGRFVAVADEMVDVAGGFVCSKDDNRIDAAGADAGAALAVDTLYYAYVSDSQATYKPLSLRLSTVAPVNLQGSKYLALAGNGSHWRFVGWVRTISNAGTPNFADSRTQRLVINYYNRLKLDLFTCPGYVNDNAPTTYVVAAGAGYVPIHGGVDDKLQFISNGEDDVQVHAYGAVALTAAATDGFILGYGLDSTVQSEEHDDQPYDGAGLADSYWHPQITDVLQAAQATEGYHELNFIAYNFSPANTVLIYADGGRSPGEGRDIECTYLWAEILG